MIQDGDRIAVGVSGGKDSLTLLVALRQLKNFLPVKFELKAITLTMESEKLIFHQSENCAKELM